jgi:hypothetical protein
MAYYSVSADRVQIPPFRDHYATLAYELLPLDAAPFDT